MKKISRHIAVIGALALAGCAAEAPPPAEPPDTRAADEAAIHAAIKEWSASAQAKDAAKFASFYTADGILMMDKMANLQGPAAIEEALGGDDGVEFAVAAGQDRRYVVALLNSIFDLQDTSYKIRNLLFNHIRSYKNNKHFYINTLS